MGTEIVRFRDRVNDLVPWWLKDRHLTSGKSVGYRFLWVIVAVLDVFAEFMRQALQASWPGLGPPDALPWIGRSRGIVRGESDTEDQYAAKLRGWLDKWAHAGSAKQLAIEIHEYLAGGPRVRVVNRHGRMVTVETDGTVTEADVAWDWDSVSNPEMAGFWSEEWIIIYPTPYAVAGNFGSGGLWGVGRDQGLGQLVTRPQVDAIKAIIAQWKGAHSKIRAVIWTSDGTLFDPAHPATMPNGNWGRWSTRGTGAPSDRNVTSCRYWEPNP